MMFQTPEQEELSGSAATNSADANLHAVGGGDAAGSLSTQPGSSLLGGMFGAVTSAAARLFHGLYDGSPSASQAPAVDAPVRQGVTVMADSPTTCDPGYQPGNPRMLAAEERARAEAAAMGQDPMDKIWRMANPTAAAERDISEAYKSGGNSQAPNRGCEPVDLETPEGRQATLNRMTQNQPGNEESEMECGAAAVLAGAIKAGGSDAVKAIINDVSTFDVNGKLDPQSEKLQKLLDDPKHNWTRQDLSDIQNKMYQQMRESEGEDADPKGGLHGDTLKKFINGDPELAQMFHDSKVEVDLINNGSPTEFNGHFVARTNNDKGLPTEVYDPYMREGGNQVITDPKRVLNYQVATDTRIQPEGQSQ